jgi:hypothetical protein
MRCPACGFENASGIKFCGECSASLQVKAYSDVQGLACANRGDDPREGDGGLNRERFPFASVKSGTTTVSVRFARQRLSASRHLRRSDGTKATGTRVASSVMIIGEQSRYACSLG